jgi:hypothetical protein
MCLDLGPVKLDNSISLQNLDLVCAPCSMLHAPCSLLSSLFLAHGSSSHQTELPCTFHCPNLLSSSVRHLPPCPLSPNSHPGSLEEEEKDAVVWCAREGQSRTRTRTRTSSLPYYFSSRWCPLSSESLAASVLVLMLPLHPPYGRVSCLLPLWPPQPWLSAQ